MKYSGEVKTNLNYRYVSKEVETNPRTLELYQERQKLTKTLKKCIKRGKTKPKNSRNVSGEVETSIRTLEMYRIRER